MLEWLEFELKELEKEHGFAYIIGHVPPYHFLHEFGIRYKALMERYQHVVRFSSFSHTHDESFFIDNAMGTDQPISWGMVHGSVGTFKGRDPNFSVIEWDEEYMVPVNIQVYGVNLTAANENPDKQPEWHLLHDYVGDYRLADLSPKSM